MSNEMERWADAAQYRREPIPAGEGGRVTPSVVLLNATPDPLGTLAALCGIYEGKVVTSLANVTDEERRAALKDMMETVLNGPLESVVFHFLITGVTRSFTHQAVRNRFAFIGQESLRFAVPEDWAGSLPLPPHLMGLPEDHPHRILWDRTMNAIEDAYAALVSDGMPAEEARGLLPHQIVTRYHLSISLRSLLAEAGKRLCTQAQFEWRLVMAEIVKALREYGRTEYKEYYANSPGVGLVCRGDGWQFSAIADLLKPVCYQEGKCGFMAKFDRGCTIRERVDANAKIGRPSSEWHLPWMDKEHEDADHADGTCGDPNCSWGDDVPRIRAIRPREWLADPGAARTAVQP